jgi:alpha-tubulin suppressor-like RCC1 family protein
MVSVASEGPFGSLSAGKFHTCGVTHDGIAHCWGYNDWGQLGTGTTNLTGPPNIPVLGGIAFLKLSAGEHHTCGVSQDGSAYCWGYNVTGELGNGTTEIARAPVLVLPPVQSAAAVSTGEP